MWPCVCLSHQGEEPHALSSVIVDGQLRKRARYYINSYNNGLTPYHRTTTLSALLVCFYELDS